MKPTKPRHASNVTPAQYRAGMRGSSTFRSRKYGKGKKKGVQKKFQLEKPTTRQVSALSNIAECKKFKGWFNYPEQEPIGIRQEYLSVTSSVSFVPLNAFYYMRSKRDLPKLASAIDGRDIFSKYLQTKLEIKYPQTQYGPQGGTRPIEVVFGFCAPLNLTDRTDPNEDAVTGEEIIEHITDIVGDDFDSKNDTMEFKDRRRRAYNIVGRFKVKPNNNSVVPSPLVATQPTTTGWGERDVPPIRRNVNFKMMKKVRYHRSHQGTPQDPPDPIMYPNQAYLPFLLLYNPDHANYKLNTTDEEGTLEVRQITMRHNTCHWFNDI